MKRSRILKILVPVLWAAVIVVLLAAVFVAAVNLLICKKTEERILDADSVGEGYDCILILGAGVRDDGRPSDMLIDRLLTGAAAYENGAGGVILASGDHGRTEYDEPNTMKRYLIDCGIPAEQIFLDHAGFSTYDSVVRAKRVFGAQKVLIVTQKYHLYRALYVAEKMGLDAYGVAADLHLYRGQSMREVREWAARTKDFLYTVFKPDPTYLGEPIDLAGSAEQTDG